MLPFTELFCVECGTWKGPATQVAEHIEVCGQREHNCPQARYGCEWKGIGSALLLHEPDCEWVPKVCSHPGCQEIVFSGTQRAHEENCGHGPVTGRGQTLYWAIRGAEASYTAAAGMTNGLAVIAVHFECCTR